MSGGETIVLLVVGLIVLFVIITVVKSVMIVPQASVAIVERLGRYKGTKEAGLAFLVPFVDKVRQRVDMREQVVTFPPQSVITQDNLTVHVDTVVYYKVIEPRDALYGVANFIDGVQNVTTTTLRNVVGGLSLEQTLTSREQINTALRGELDDATGRWASGSTGWRSRPSTRRRPSRTPWNGR